MGAYICNECGGLFCSSEDVCHEDPTNNLELICDTCYEEKHGGGEFDDLSDADKARYIKMYKEGMEWTEIIDILEGEAVTDE